jgi:hypothetical protein
MPHNLSKRLINFAVFGCAMSSTNAIPEGLTKTLPAGCIKRIHVNQNLLRRAVAGEDVCPYTVQYKGKSHPCKSAVAHEGVEFVNSISKPLSCGARLYGQTTGPVTLSLI